MPACPPAPTWAQLWPWRLRLNLLLLSGRLIRQMHQSHQLHLIARRRHFLFPFGSSNEILELCPIRGCVDVFMGGRDLRRDVEHTVIDLLEDGERLDRARAAGAEQPHVVAV